MQVFFEDYLGAETAFCHTPKGLNLLKEHFSDMLSRQTGRPWERPPEGRERQGDGLTAIPLHQKMF